ncbi:MAG TPA: Rpn family recombination-promoting nuclease/putative transposase [Candidatus Competibacteraceae bacterium]|nr:Rpn family recombination-promoting nuclease/putative transposase [Candidatus Competibacteraceae bacterium]HRZ06045.1 Rpn family recombination-promoting nuclease/putative transposase [Candidatus Competibacteraceae bacterium]HSA45429.1 Rpn family recombination-promoting nuclease/putative transposase [Candidatus Competibacteraceae bacterium]
MAVRVLTCIDLLYQNLIRSRQLGKSRRLPAVFPIVLYNGRRQWTAPIDLDTLMEPGPAGLAAYRPQARYLLIDESAYVDAELCTDESAWLARLQAAVEEDRH